MSRNFSTDVDTQREYFNASYFNQSGQNQIAKYETTLLKPFFNDPDKWKLAINRMRIPLSGIPLTRNNIPFEQWEVGLYYQTDDEGAGQQEDIQFVPQINPKSETLDTYFNLSSNYNSQDVALQPVFDVLSESTIANINYNIQPAFESSNGKKTFYVMDNLNNDTINVYQNNSNVVVATLTAPAQIAPNVLTGISSICADQAGNFYIGYGVNNTTTGLNTLYIQEYTRTTATSWTIGINYYPTDVNISQFGVRWSTICVYNNVIYGYAQVGQAFDYFDTWILGTPANVDTGDSNSFNWLSIADDTFIYRYDNTGNLTASNGIIINYTYTQYAVNRFLGFDVDGYMLFYGYTTTNPTNTYYAIDAKSGSGAIKYTFSPTNDSYGLLYNTTNNILFDSGPYDIFTYQAFLNQINLAFQTSFNNLKAQMGSTFQPTEPPSIIYNAQTRLFNLIVEGQYLIKNTDGSNQYKILFNLPLWNKFYFPSNAFSPNYQEIILQNYGINAITGTGSNTTPQFIYIQQEDSTIYAFYDLTRIILGTISIPVSGDGEGKTFSNNGFSSNNTINMITDVVPDTTTLTPGTVLIYVPAGILRWYNLYAQQPFQKVDLIMYYETKDGNIYPVEIVNGEYFSVKLEFKKGPGDF
jgi:hypothetical protein